MWKTFFFVPSMQECGSDDLKAYRLLLVLPSGSSSTPSQLNVVVDLLPGERRQVLFALKACICTICGREGLGKLG